MVENCSLSAYKDSTGTWTIGWGETGPNVREGMTCTQKEADDWLGSRLLSLSKEIKASVADFTLPNQLDALVSFAYNAGFKALKESSLLRMHNAGYAPGTVAAEFLRWKYSKGRVLRGLLRRRAVESVCYLGGEWPLLVTLWTEGRSDGTGN